MKNLSEFIVGRKYIVPGMKNPVSMRGFTSAGLPIMERGSNILTLNAWSHKLSDWQEHREPREFFLNISYKGDKWGPTVCPEEYVEECRRNGYETIKVREVIE